jgi:hypothetical protein
MYLNNHKQGRKMTMKSDFDPRDPVMMFNAITPDAVQLELCKQIHTQYAVAAEHCYDVFLDAEARDVLPYYRRACIESALVDCLAKYNNFKVIAATNIIKNWAHRAIIASDRVLITHSSVNNRTELPRKALFRQGYARSAQMYLFEDDRPPDPDPSMYLYAIITHCPSGAIKTPEFIDIVFPDENYEKAIATIPLLTKFPQVGRVDTEEIKDDLKLKETEIRLKEKRKA